MGQKDLVYITAIARAGNISRAAEELQVAQPSLTRCLQRVEAGLGTQLFFRTPEGLAPTQAGEIYLESAYQILRAYREMERKIAGVEELKGGRVTVGATTFLASYVLPDILSVFHSLYPSVTVNVEEVRSAAVEEAVAGGGVDLGFLHTPVSSSRLNLTVMARERFLLAVPPEDPLVRYAYVQGRGKERYMDLSMTQNRDFICTYPGQRSRLVADGIFRRAGLAPRVHYQTRSIQTAMRMAYAGLGLTLVPHSYCTLVSRDSSPAYFFLEPSLGPSWELAAATARELPVSRAARELLRISRDVIPYLYKEDAEAGEA